LTVVYIGTLLGCSNKDQDELVPGNIFTCHLS